MVSEPFEERRIAATPKRKEDRRTLDEPPEASIHGPILAVLVGIAVVVRLILAYQALTVLKVTTVAVLLAIVLRTVARALEGTGASPVVATLLLLAGSGVLGEVLGVLFAVPASAVPRGLFDLFRPRLHADG